MRHRVSPDGPSEGMAGMSQMLAPSESLGEVSIAHREIRVLLDELGTLDHADRSDAAERLCVAVAGHRATCTESVVHRAGRIGAEHEQQARLLIASTHGVPLMVARLRL